MSMRIVLLYLSILMFILTFMCAFLCIWLISGQWFFTGVTTLIIAGVLLGIVEPRDQKDFFKLLRGKDDKY